MRRQLKVKVLDERIGKQIPFPQYMSSGAAGFDLYACLDESITLNPGETKMIKTGIAIQIPGSDLVALIYARSGLGIKHGIIPSNCVGVIDSDYRGEVMVGLYNHNQESFTINPGDRIAQMVITPVVQVEILNAVRLDETERGAGGFGSTGIN